jgi:hypothetical protein
VVCFLQNTIWHCLKWKREYREYCNILGKEYETLGAIEYINHVQIFEKKRQCDGL